MRRFKIAVCQMMITENKAKNLIKEEEMIRETKSQGLK